MEPAIRPQTILLGALTLFTVIVAGWAFTSPEAMATMADDGSPVVLTVAAIAFGGIGLAAILGGRGLDKALGGIVLAIASYAAMFAGITGSTDLPVGDAEDFVSPVEAWGAMGDADDRFDATVAALQAAEN